MVQGHPWFTPVTSTIGGDMEFGIFFLMFGDGFSLLKNKDLMFHTFPVFRAREECVEPYMY